MRDPEKRKAWKIKYAAENRAKLLASNARYDAEHKERKKAYRAKRYAENRDALLEKDRKYKSEHKEELKEKSKKSSRSFKGRHNNLKHALRRDGVSDSDLLWSFNFYSHLVCGSICHYCFGKLNETGGGLDRISNVVGHTCYNVVPCCRQCNRIKGNDISYEEMMVLSPALRKIRSERVQNSSTI